MADDNRPRDFANGVSLNGTDSDRASASPWLKNIWNNNNNGTIGSALNPVQRDGPRARGIQAERTPIEGPAKNDKLPENPLFATLNANFAEGRRGPTSLAADSMAWQDSRPVWGDYSASNMAHIRSSGASPARKRSVMPTQQGQPYSETPPSTFFSSRNAAMGQSGSAAMSLQPLLDANTTSFTTTRQPDSHAFSNYGFSQAEIPKQRLDAAGTASAWPESILYSPCDERRSTANSDYYAPSSGTASRSGSLPPSRHGADPSQYNQLPDTFSRFPQAGPRQPSSISFGPGRLLPSERSASIHSESIHFFNKLTIDQDQEMRAPAHRASVSTNGFAPTYNTSSHDPSLYVEAKEPTSQDETTPSKSGTYTPESYGHGHFSDQFRPSPFDSTRGAPNGNGLRQSPFYSNTHTPPVYDHLNPNRSDQTLSHPLSLAQLQTKLAGLQPQHNQRAFLLPAQLHPQYPNTLPPNQLRHPYTYQYPISALPAHLSMSPMVPVHQLPRGPREPHVHSGTPSMSATLAVFKREQKQNKHWELTDLYGHIVEFAGDQHGSRFIQQKLEAANSEMKERIFGELVDDALQLMQDVFGNYVIQKFFEHGDQAQKRVLAGKMKGHVQKLSNQMYACRVVQKALEYVLTDQQAALVKELEKDVIKTVQDQNGNHVIQKVIERVPIQYIQVIVESFRGQVGKLSVNSYGCRVIQRLLERVPEPQRRFILGELHAEGAKLITDSYGNYVTQHVIEHGLPEDRAKVIALVKAQFCTFSKHKFASNVVESCLKCGGTGQRRELLVTIIAKNDRGEMHLASLLKDGFGNYVIQKMLETLDREDYDMFISILRPELEKLKKSIPGKLTLSVEKKMHRFDRIDSPVVPRDDATLDPASSTQSPKSASLPSTNSSSIDEPVHTPASETNKNISTAQANGEGPETTHSLT